MNRGPRKNHFLQKLFPARLCRWNPLRLLLLDRHVSLVACLCPLAR